MVTIRNKSTVKQPWIEYGSLVGLLCSYLIILKTNSQINFIPGR